MKTFPIKELNFFFNHFNLNVMLHLVHLPLLDKNLLPPFTGTSLISNLVAPELYSPSSSWKSRTSSSQHLFSCEVSLLIPRRDVNFLFTSPTLSLSLSSKSPPASQQYWNSLTSSIMQTLTHTLLGAKCFFKAMLQNHSSSSRENHWRHQTFPGPHFL